MQWAKDNEIGSIPTQWNWLEGWNTVVDDGKLTAVHFTPGGPWFDDYQDVDFATEWKKAAEKVYTSGVLPR